MPKAVIINQIPGKPGEVYYPLSLIETPQVPPKDDEIVIKLLAVALNHRDHFIRQALYPGISFTTPLLADGAGSVVETGPNATNLLHKRVLLYPATGWQSNPEGPEGSFAILGGTKGYEKGTLAEFITVSKDDVEVVPEHLGLEEAAALPLAGLTAWRTLVTKSQAAEKGRNVLVTGIGGGVALMVLLFGVSKGCNMFVTSSSDEKIQRAIEMGAKGGVKYTESGWEKKLQTLLPAEHPVLDAVIDGAGGDGISKLTRALKTGGTIVSYGMTFAPTVSFPMAAVLKNIELRGSTMGSRHEFKEMISFVASSEIRPIVSRVVKATSDLKGVEELFGDMRSGKQFGKLVIDLSEGFGDGREGSKLDS